MAAILRRLGYPRQLTALSSRCTHILSRAQLVNHRNGRPLHSCSGASEKLILVSTGARDWLESNGQVERAEGGYRVSARKSFASGSPAGSVVVTSAPFEDPAEGAQVLHFGVPLTAAGVSLHNDWYTHGMRATGSGTVVMEKVFVPDAAISLKRPRSGFAPIFNVVAAVALPLITGVYVGVAERAVEIATGLAKKRANDATVQWSVGEMLSALRSHRPATRPPYARPTSWTSRRGTLSSEAFILKTHIVEQAKKAVEAAVEASGGAGFYRVNGLERLLRDVRAGHYHPLPVKQQMVFTGRLGLDPAD